MAESPSGNAGVDAEQPARTKKRWIWIAVIGCAVLFVPCLGLVAALVVPAVFSRIPPLAQSKKAEVDLAQIEVAVTMFAVQNNGRLPESLELLVIPDAAGKRHLTGYTSVPLDPWGRPYAYEPLEGGEFRVSSLGPDGVVSGDDVDPRRDLRVSEER